MNDELNSAPLNDGAYFRPWRPKGRGQGRGAWATTAAAPLGSGLLPKPPSGGGLTEQLIGSGTLVGRVGAAVGRIVLSRGRR